MKKGQASGKTKLFIKRMVCQHCIEAVLQSCRDVGLEVHSVKLGEVVVNQPEEEIDKQKLEKRLAQSGFELLEDKELQLVEAIKTAVIQIVHYADKLPEIKNSIYLSDKLGYAYPYLSKLFSRHEGITIEKYIILQKIERTKELLSYQEKNLNEIAFDLGYSSVQHLSNQFKSVTGMSVSEFKKLEDKGRKALNEL